jgi:hypothetical protein
MPTPFTNGAQNADKLFSKFANGDVTFFTMATTTIQTVATAAHGLSAAPDFVIVGLGSLDAAASAGSSWSATATTLTVSHDNTLVAETICVFVANIS